MVCSIYILNGNWYYFVFRINLSSNSKSSHYSTSLKAGLFVPMAQTIDSRVLFLQEESFSPNFHPTYILMERGRHDYIKRDLICLLYHVQLIWRTLSLRTYQKCFDIYYNMIRNIIKIEMHLCSVEQSKRELNKRKLKNWTWLEMGFTSIAIFRCLTIFMIWGCLSRA